METHRHSAIWALRFLMSQAGCARTSSRWVSGGARPRRKEPQGSNKIYALATVLVKAVCANPDATAAQGMSAGALEHT